MRRAFPLLFLITFIASCGGSPATAPATSSAPPAITIVAPKTTLAPVGVTLVAPAGTPAPGAPSPTPEQVVGPDTYPPGINPLTGLPAAAAALNRRPLAVKISNFPRYVRPQFGLSLADAVFEHYAEGGTTRFTAIFLSHDADKVGPIRSARLIDTVIPEMYGAALVASGSSTGVITRLSYKPWFNLVVAERTGYQCPPLCRESEDTNSLFASTIAIHKALHDKGVDDSPQAHRGLSFFSRPPAGGDAVTALRVDFSGEAHTEWRYDPATGLYDRWSDASAIEVTPHIDALTKQPITAANVVVLFANHVVDFSIPEDFDNGGYTGHFSTEVQLWATGPAWLLRDGQAYRLTWVRLHSGDMVGLVDAANRVVPLKPGNTWYEVVGLSSEKTDSGSNWSVRHKSPVDEGEIPGVPTPTATVEGATAEAPTGTPTTAP